MGFRRVVVTASLLGLAAFAGGCKNATRAREAEFEKKRAEVLAAAEEVKSWREAYERRQSGAERKAAREAARLQAADLLAAGSAAQALEKLASLLEPARAVRTDPATGKEETVAVDPPLLDDAERIETALLKSAALAELGRKDEAAAELEAALKLDPGHSRVRRELGKIQFAADKRRQALETWKPLLAAGERDTEILLKAGRAYAEIGKSERNPMHLEAARLAFETALLGAPDDAELNRQLIEVALETGRYADAARRCDIVLRDNPLDPEFLGLLGDALIKSGELRRALDVLELAAGMRAPGESGYRALGDLCRTLGYPARAAEWLELAYKGEPGLARAEDRFAIGSLFYESGRADRASTWLAAIGESEARFGEAQALLVRAYGRAGRADEALAAYESVRRLRPQDGETHLVAGEVLLARRQIDEATDAFSRATAEPATRAAGFAGLGEVAYAKKNLPAAAYYFRRALELRPGEARWIVAVQGIEGEILLAKTGPAGAAAPRAAKSGGAPN